MKRHLTNLHPLLLAIICAAWLQGCTSSRPLRFAGRQWLLSPDMGQLIDSDTTWRVTFGDILIPADMPVIASSDSAARYPGLDKFLGGILHTARLDNATILFYAPQMECMLVKTDSIPIPQRRPSSVSSPLSDQHPFTIWIYPDDKEDWTRPHEEMHTHTYIDRRKKQLLVVDHFDYGDQPVAWIHIYQSRTKSTDRMRLPSQWTFLIHDMDDLERDIEFWSNKVDSHRKLSFANFRLGQLQQQNKIKSNTSRQQ